MLIIPAIDLRNGKVVRLTKGAFDQETVYSLSPADVMQKWQREGAKLVHVVDLDGARAGRPMNQAIIQELVQKTNLRIEVGGGIRSVETASQYLDVGVDRIILGTTAIQQPEIVGQLINHYGTDRVIVGLDMKSNILSTEGWTANSGLDLKQVLKQLKSVRTVIVTDIHKDGMFTGPNFSLCQAVKDQGFDVIVSGGVGDDADVERAKQLGMSVIVGKALYEGKVKLLPKGFTKRIIACLDIANGRVVKGTQFTDLRDQGDPIELAQRYEDQGADEIIFLDIMATVENRETLYRLVSRVAETLAIPFCVGGGVRSVEDIRRLLLAGADKVSIGSAVVSNPKLVEQASAQFGAQCIVVSVDPKWNGSFWEMYTRGGRTATGVDAIQFAQQMEQAGAGELLVNSLDKDGTKQGYDVPLLHAVSQAVTIPVIASSGVGTIQHIRDAFDHTTVSAALVAGVLHSGELTIQDIKSHV